MARTLFEIKLHEIVDGPQSRHLEENHRLRNLADIDSLTEGGQHMDRISSLKGVSKASRTEITKAFTHAVEALSPKEKERREFSWLKGKPRTQSHDPATDTAPAEAEGGAE